MKRALRNSMLAAAVLLVVSTSGCSMIARRLATADPGMAPRDGLTYRVSAVGSEQVRVTFAFKIGKDPVVEQRLPAVDASSDASAGSAADISAAPAATDQPAAPQRSLERDESAVLYADVPIRVIQATFIDRGGRSVEVVDYDLRRESNVCYVSFTSGAVNPDSYEIICQAQLSAGSYQVAIASTVTRELTGWRSDPRSLRFAVYGTAERLPRWQFNMLGR